MKAFAWMRARPKTLASAAVVGVASIALTTMAFAYEGNPTTKVDLNDGGVWVTKTSSLLVGHFNRESEVLDGGLRTVGENFDVRQDGANVLVVDADASTITTVNTARVALGDSAAIPTDAAVELGADTTAILDRKTGDLWVVPVQSISGFEIASAKPTAELGKNADVAVGRDGTVYGLAAEKGEVVTIPVDAEGVPGEARTASVGEIGTSKRPSITAVGDTAVVLDAAAGVILAPGGLSTEIEDADAAVLQMPSEATDAVAVATSSALLRVPLDGSEVVSAAAGGEGVPAAPVQLKGCTYAAWAGSAQFVRDCVGDGNDLHSTVEGAESVASLTFRVNRDVIILNDVVGGAAWLADQSLERVDNWSDLTPPDGESENEEDSTETTEETTLPKRTDVNTPPEANDDSFGVRPGATTVLPVLDNDNDPDGDVLVATVKGDGPSLGVVQQIQNGGALQITVPADATGSATFTYEADDGRDGRDSATVTVVVHPEPDNAPPKPKRKTSLAVEAGGTISYNILPDWIDPDGDDIYLKDVIAAPGDEVEFTTDGQFTYKATASLPGRKDIQVTVADAHGKIGSSTIALDVRPVGSTDPKTNADHVITYVGESITVAPLANDTSTSSEPLRLSRVLDTDGATITPNTENRTFDFVANAVDVYYVQYQVTTGPKMAEGIVRVDVIERTETDQAPIAVRDVALLPTGGDVLLGVLDNDSDPAGGVLVVQSVSVEPSSGISVSVLNHETLRITDQGALSDQVRISYRISNGSKSADGDVVVIPIPAPDELLPPVANPDTAKVRVGDVVTIPVLDNDVAPAGDALHVEPELVEGITDPADGEAFVSQDTVRFRAGSEPGTVTLTYNAVDSRQNKAAAAVTIQVLPIEEDVNAAPRPRDVTLRTLAGAVSDIVVPLDGIDSDGDSVELIGLASNPTKGRITANTATTFTYEANDSATGVDSFTYKVKDRLGKEGIATIRVGIAPPEDINHAPYAVKDSVVVRPGREIAVPVLANDSDPEGDALTLVKDGLTVPDILKAKVSGNRVMITAPEEPTETSLQYTVVDARGASSTATVQVTVDPDVPLQAPIARDDRVQLTDITDDSMNVALDLLVNDEDPDGTLAGLDLEVGDGGTKLEDGTVQVTITNQLQLVRYTITDQDGLSASAFIFVPAKSELRPALKGSTKPVSVISGETKEIPLSDYVVVAGGGSVQITEAGKVKAMHANGASLLKDAHTLVYTSAEDYFGQDSLTFEVTDGTSPEDPDGRKATLSIPIDVQPPANQQPAFVQGEISVAAGEDAVSLDLAALTTDPDKDDTHTFRLLGGEGKGVSASIDGNTISAKADADAKKGTAVALKVEISDGETDPIEGVVTVNVTASTRDLPVANTDTLKVADQGETYTIDALKNDVNPFEDEGPLKITSVNVESGDGEAGITKDQKIEVSSAGSFVGTIVVSYRIQDVTKDRDREVTGKVVVNVQGVPDAPGVPQIVSVEDRKVVVSWSAPQNNGAEITGYTVSSTSGKAYSKQCASTTCTLDNLTNNVEYTFQVIATNRVGESPASKASAPARPDARPDQPNAPKLVFGDKSLKISWETPTTPGSPVKSYTLEISPAPPNGITQKTATGNSMVWEGLENGSDYQVKIQAHNSAPQASTWSAWSNSEIPAGPPFKPAAPSTAELTPVGDQAQMQVTWTAPNKNGDAIDGYRLEILEGGTVVRTVTPGAQATSQAVVVPTSSTPYTYRLQAHNKAGWGELSDQSAPRRATVAPGAPTSLTVTEGDGSLKLAYNAPQRTGGATAAEMSYQYSLDGGGTWTGMPGDLVIGGLSNGTDYTFVVRAVSNVTGSTYVGPASNSASGNPHGTPRAPEVSAVPYGASQVQLSWNANGSANGRAITEVQYSVDGGAWQGVAMSGSIYVGSYSEYHSIKAKAKDSTGAWSAESGIVGATAAAKPQPSARTVQGEAAPERNCTPMCYRIGVEVSNFPAGGGYTVTCYYGDGTRFAGGQAPWTFPENGAGYLSDPSIWQKCYTADANRKGVQARIQGNGIDLWATVVHWR